MAQSEAVTASDKVITSNDAADVVFNLINNVENFDDKKIDIFIIELENGETETWFKGKDIADVLGYKNTKTAVSDNVDPDDRSPLENIVNRMYGTSYHLKLNKIQLKTIYINESGLYCLIMSSKLPTAKKFKKWITADLLPKIRKIGQTKYLEELRQLQEENIKLKKRELRLRPIIENLEPLVRNQFFYIATSEAYIRQHKYKFGGCASEKDLTNNRVLDRKSVV
jgi:prophage antirepressor-like protein